MECGKLFEAAGKALGELGLDDCDLEKVEDLADISAMGAMITPALAIDGEIVVAGRVPSVEELKAIISR